MCFFLAALFPAAGLSLEDADWSTTGEAETVAEVSVDDTRATDTPPALSPSVLSSEEEELEEEVVEPRELEEGGSGVF